MKRIITILILIGMLFTLTSCREHQSKASYFEGKVLVEYHQTDTRSADDNLTLSFYGPGLYEVSFSTTPGQSDRGAQSMPKDFHTAVLLSPRVHVINQFKLPDFLRVSIKRNGNLEVHDFA